MITRDVTTDGYDLPIATVDMRAGDWCEIYLDPDGWKARHPTSSLMAIWGILAFDCAAGRPATVMARGNIKVIDGEDFFLEQPSVIPSGVPVTALYWVIRRESDLESYNGEGAA
jgi:hypothetical protein